MLALIPYFSIPLMELGPLVLDSWAILVSLGFIVGLEISRARGIRLGLDVKDVVDGALFIVGMGFVGGHVMHVLAYNPHLLEEQGIWALLRIWAGFSSTGGFIGAVLGAILFYRVIRPRDFWKHADTVMFGFPFGWFLGRMGCFSAHDHVGASATFFLAVDFPEPWGPRHDLGLYEALLVLIICATFWGLRNRPVRPGLFTAIFAALYAPIRFSLDFLRNTDLSGADTRYAGLTPAQYGMLVMFTAGVSMIFWLQRSDGPKDTPKPRPTT
ncbi:MAG: phosphatidylglycerol:prolipoprotein diacylglycerol transferase [Myxococcota bacterium]|jgi:phosphatidylglycerol:prolipoprotein diacylglycerol transferase